MSKERSDQIRFMRWMASGIGAGVRLYRRDGLRPAVAGFLFSAFRHAKRTVPEGRLDNRPALQLQRRLLTISNSAPSRRAGVSRVSASVSAK
jgi:hypothetical protein